MNVDGEILVLPAGALRFLWACTTTLAASDIGMGAVPDIQTYVVELLACGTAIAVALGKIGETLRTVERDVLPQGAVPGAHIGGGCFSPATTAETRHCRRWHRPPPIAVLVLATGRNE